MATLVLRDNRHVPAALLARVLGPFTDAVFAADAARALRYSGGVLLRRVDDETARAALEAVRAEGLDAFVADEDALGEAPRPRKAMAVEAMEGALHVAIGHEGNVDVVPLEEVRAIYVTALAVPVRGQARREERAIESARFDGGSGSDADRLQARLNAFEAESRGHATLDLSVEIYCAPPPRIYRLPRREASYRALEGTGDRSLGNFLALCRWLAATVAGVLVPDATRAFLDGADIEAILIEKPEELRSYRDWLHLTLAAASSGGGPVTPVSGPPA